MPLTLDWSPERDGMRGDHPAALLRPAPEDALQEWIVATRVNRAGVGDDDRDRQLGRLKGTDAPK